MIAKYLPATLLSVMCLAGPAAAFPTEATSRTVALALSYFDSSERRFSVSDEWRSLNGETLVCARADIPNGAGGWAPTSDFSMFFLSNGTVVNMTKDNSVFGCTNRTFVPLQPLPKSKR
jgi:hypothetical protein